jgi:hypothetical protein
MSNVGVEIAVEQIRSDRALAESVAAEGAPALSSFDLTEHEAAELADALRADVEAALGEVSGFAMAPFGSIPLPTLVATGRRLGVDVNAPVAPWIERGQPVAGWIERF